MLELVTPGLSVLIESEGEGHPAGVSARASAPVIINATQTSAHEIAERTEFATEFFASRANRAFVFLSILKERHLSACAISLHAPASAKAAVLNVQGASAYQT